MTKKSWFIFVTLLFVFSNFTFIQEARAETNDTQETYEVYPIPQNETYFDHKITITDEVNIVVEDDIDSYTVDFLHKILEENAIDYDVSSSLDEGKTNILLGTDESGDYVDEYFSNISYDTSVFEEIDSYVLSINNDVDENGTIAILGDTTDATYYGLATLKMVLKQVEGNEVEAVLFEDYAHTEWRGFIEGFYGFPWSHEARISLMEYGGEFKMNSYIFGPKDDIYHNAQWRTLYPDDELEKVEELVEVGNESKTHFIWAIHPGFSMVDWDDYDNELDTMIEKFEQLYDVGVRQFGIFMDDIGLDQSLDEVGDHVRLVSDIAEWVDGKGDVKPLIYCPPFYNLVGFICLYSTRSGGCISNDCTSYE